MPKIIDKEDVRSRILDATMEVCAAMDFHTASIDTIAKACGVGTLCLYVKSKKDMITALSDRIFHGLEDAFMGHGQYETLEDMEQRLKQTMPISKEHQQVVRVFFDVYSPRFASGAFVKSIADSFEKAGQYYAGQVKGLQARGIVSTDIAAAAWLRRPFTCCAMACAPRPLGSAMWQSAPGNHGARYPSDAETPGACAQRS